METKTFQVPNVGCNGCVRTIQSELTSLEGVKAVSGVVETKMVTVEYTTPATWDQIVAKLVEIEYAPA